jgi:hypothetical protein
MIAPIRKHTPYIAVPNAFVMCWTLLLLLVYDVQ